MKVCQIEGCEKRVLARSMCSTHYQRVARHGDPHVNNRHRRHERECAHCSTSFQVKPSAVQKYCSWTCYHAHEAPQRRLAAMSKVCAVDGCAARHWAGDYCSMHYQRVMKTGHPGPVEPYSKTGEGNSNWRGGRVRAGEKMRYWKRYMPAHPAADALGYVLEHRLVAEVLLGRYLRADEVVHHINHDPSDNRPENVSVMTHAEHMRHHAAERTQCRRGHEYTQDNTYVDKRGQRNCRTCKIESQHRRQARKRAEVA
jgi:hypothetical protein